MNSRSVFFVGILCVARSAGAGESWDEVRRHGTAARLEGRYFDAKHYLDAALSQFPTGRDDIRRADLEDELASVYELLGDEAGAERLYRDAIAVIRKHPDHAPGLEVTVTGDFGAFLANQGRFTEAVAHLDAGMAKSREIFGEADIKTATMKSSLGQLHLLRGEFPEAERLLREAVEVHRATLPPAHLDRIVSESSLGYLYMLERRYDKSEPILQQVNEHARELGDTHPTLAFTLTNLADLYRVEGKSGRSGPLLRRALAIYENSLGPESLKVAEALMDISIDLITSKKYAIAEDDLSRALRILRKTNGPDSASYAIAEYRLATAYLNSGRYAEAETLLRHAVPIAEKTWPDGHVVVAAFLYEMAEVERFRRQYADAELLYKRCIAIYERFEPSGSPGLTLALKQYGKMRKTGRTAQAKAFQ